MILKKYILKSPISTISEDVYEYPVSLASLVIQYKDCILVTREPLKIPILVVPSEYLTQVKNEGISEGNLYADFSHLNYWLDNEKIKGKQEKHDTKLYQLSEIFSIGNLHKRSCESIFFTGPKKVYKQIFKEDWVWTDNKNLTLKNIGTFISIESLSLSNLDTVFIKGSFACGHEIVENTQVKITISNK